MRSLSIKRREFLFCLSGAVFSAALCIAILSVRYGDNLVANSQKLMRLGLKSEAMKKSVHNMEAIVDRLRPSEQASELRPREAILASLDKIKKRLNASSFIVSNFNEAGNELQLGVNIEAPLTDYTSFTKNIKYLESMSLPWFKTEKILIEKNYDGFLVKLKGTAVMPLKGGSRSLGR